MSLTIKNLLMGLSMSLMTIALGIVRSIPSEETLRQRMDDIGPSLRSYILAENIRMLRDNGIVPGKLPNGYVPVDIDVTPFDNSKTKKQGVLQIFGYKCHPAAFILRAQGGVIRSQKQSKYIKLSPLKSNLLRVVQSNFRLAL